ncbi:hypothetical protein NC651_036814 [Populus alba x Populus x berolinensis]|nr:hypothetical protein NC651_036814 [Populus alba x Populus x berolinensis]
MPPPLAAHASDALVSWERQCCWTLQCWISFGKGCYDVEVLMSTSGGMWSTVMVGRFVVASDG